MNLGIATDVANTAFSGAVSSPDSLLNAEFYFNEPIDKFASEEKRTVVRLPKHPFIRIAKPGDNLTVIERFASAQDIQRFPKEWMLFQLREGLVSGTAGDTGWPLKEWDGINADQLRNLEHLRFQTVEQVAGASDAAVIAIGMGGMALRDQAKKALINRANASGQAQLAERDAKIDALTAQVEALAARLDAPPQHRETLGVKK